MRRTNLALLSTLSLLVPCLAANGCSSEGGEKTAETTGAIINGTTVTTDSIGTPRITWPTSTGGTGLCSSTLLGDHVLLTAHHCLTNESVFTGGTPLAATSVTATLLNGTSAKGARVFLHPTLDVALLELGSALGGSSAAVYSGATSALVGKSLYCQGWGQNTFTSGAGTLRSAYLTVKQAEPGGYELVPNASGQIEIYGDSGSSCFISQNGGMALTGVTSSGHVSGSTVLDCHHVGAEDTRSWIQSTLATLPTVTAMTPARGGEGTVVYITGTNLVNPAITVGASQVSNVTCPSSTQCHFSAPRGTGAQTVTVTIGGATFSPGTFTYAAAPGCTYAFHDTPSDNECGGAVTPYCPAAYAAFQNNTTADPVAIYKASSANGPWTLLWDVAYSWTSPSWPKVTEPTGSTIYLMGCTSGPPGDCDAPTAVQVTQYSCTGSCTPLSCVPGAGVLCGSVYDPCTGQTLSCGSCGAGSTCQSNGYCSTVCTTPECQCTEKGGIWDPTTHTCHVCNTPACQCARAGGTWDGSSCT